MVRKHLIATFLLLAIWIGSLGFAQDIEGPMTEDSVETPVAFRYFIPFPESTFRGDWRFRLEMGVTLPVAYKLTLIGYDALGRQVMEQASEPLSRWAVFSWEDPDAIVANRIQSLAVIADAPLHGFLWLWNDLLGIINGVAVTELKGERLVMPHVPSDFFAWRTSFAVQGVSSSGGNGDIVFGYNNGGTRSQVNAWRGLKNHGYFTGSPFYNILISDVPTVTWGSVSAATPGFEVAGFQSFQTMEGRFQSGAIELVGAGVSRGFFGLSSNEAQTFREWFAFTNPNNAAALVEVTLHYLPITLEDEEVEPVTVVEAMTLAPFERKNIVLGGNLFSEHKGVYISMGFAVKPPSEDEDPLTIYGTHLQSDQDRTALGAHAQTPELTNHTATWLDFDETLFDQVLELYNPGVDLVSLTMTLTNNLGDPLFERVVEIKPGNRVVLTTGEVKELLLADFEDLNFDQPFRIDLLSAKGRFFAKLTAVRDGDFAIVNPFSEFLPLEPDVEPEPEPQGE